MDLGTSDGLQAACAVFAYLLAYIDNSSDLCAVDVVLIGAGNLGTSVAQAIVLAGMRLLQVATRSVATAQRVAQPLGASAAPLEGLSPHADLYLLAVPDAQIVPVLQALPPLRGLVLHTSGSTSLSVFGAEKFPRHGVLYPLQTFSRQRLIGLDDVPLCVEGCSAEVEAEIMALAQRLSRHVVRMNSQQRAWLHLMAVMGCNFVNHLLALAQQVGGPHGIDLGLLRPLLDETVRKAFEADDPAHVQTGPAVRRDANTLAQHRAMLGVIDVHLPALYDALSQSIVRTAERIETQTQRYQNDT